MTPSLQDVLSKEEDRNTGIRCCLWQPVSGLRKHGPFPECKGFRVLIGSMILSVCTDMLSRGRRTYSTDSYSTLEDTASRCNPSTLSSILLANNASVPSVDTLPLSLLSRTQAKVCLLVQVLALLGNHLASITLKSFPISVSPSWHAGSWAPELAHHRRPVSHPQLT